MKLSTSERITLLDILPKEGNIITLRVVRDLQNQLSFNDKEIEKLGLNVINGGVTWNKDADREIDFDFSEAALGIIKDTLTKLEESSKLQVVMVPLYDKVMGVAKGKSNEDKKVSK